MEGDETRGERRVATNQAPPLVGHNVVTSDAALVEAVTRHASPEVVDELATLGAEAGSAEAREHGMLANQHHPNRLGLRPENSYRLSQFSHALVGKQAADLEECERLTARQRGGPEGIEVDARPCD